MTTPLRVGDQFVVERRPARFDGVVRARGDRLVDGRGNEVLLRGVGLGTWLLPEGYMWRFGPGAESPREIERLVERLAGADYASRFWPRFFDAFITEEDVALIAASGFDHVRLPINARVIQHADGSAREDGYALIDRLIAWCRRHHLWVLLDLHGAPGGQTGTNIDDSRGQPDLFLEPGYRERTIELWRELARRYRGETTVLGYDLLNEPLPNQWQHRFAAELTALYRDLTATVRAEDADHLIMYEGSHWATNWEIFTERWDDNQVLQFHKYWSSPDRASIARFLEVRDRLGVPIYMGEGGENTPEWLYTAFRLYEAEQIGWNFWPWKKIETRTSPLSVRPPAGWDAVRASAGGPAQLTPHAARAAFDELLENVAPNRAEFRPEIVAALLGVRPESVPAWGFGARGEGQSWFGAGQAALPGIREDDAVAIRFARPELGSPANPFEQSDGRDYAPEEELVVELPPGGWLEFEFDDAPDPELVRVVDDDGRDVSVTVERTPRGLRVTAGLDGARLSRLLSGRRAEGASRGVGIVEAP